jgi:hypothetical protein
MGCIWLSRINALEQHEEVWKTSSAEEQTSILCQKDMHDGKLTILNIIIPPVPLPQEEDVSRALLA